MSKLPSVTGSEAVRAFSKLGFSVARIRGSHYILKGPGHPYVLSVPVHARQNLKPGTLRSLIKAAEITPEEFAALLH